MWWTLPKVYTDSVSAECAMRSVGAMFDNRIEEQIIVEQDIEA